MKKKVIVIGMIILLISVIISFLYIFFQRKKAIREWTEEEIRLIDYWEQNVAFEMDASLWESGYQGYNNVNKEKLYVNLEVYNSWNKQTNNKSEILLLVDIENYLSSECNEDESFRINSRPSEIQRYIKWFFDNGNEDIDEFRIELEIIASEYKISHPEIADKVISNMTTEQLQELINKYNDPSYEINPEIMGATQ